MPNSINISDVSKSDETTKYKLKYRWSVSGRGIDLLGEALSNRSTRDLSKLKINKKNDAILPQKYRMPHWVFFTVVTPLLVKFFRVMKKSSQDKLPLIESIEQEIIEQKEGYPPIDIKIHFSGWHYFGVKIIYSWLKGKGTCTIHKIECRYCVSNEKNLPESTSEMKLTEIEFQAAYDAVVNLLPHAQWQTVLDRLMITTDLLSYIKTKKNNQNLGGHRKCIAASLYRLLLTQVMDKKVQERVLDCWSWFNRYLLHSHNLYPQSFLSPYKKKKGRLEKKLNENLSEEFFNVQESGYDSSIIKLPVYAQCFKKEYFNSEPQTILRDLTRIQYELNGHPFICKDEHNQWNRTFFSGFLKRNGIKDREIIEYIVTYGHQMGLLSSLQVLVEFFINPGNQKLKQHIYVGNHMMDDIKARQLKMQLMPLSDSVVMVLLTAKFYKLLDPKEMICSKQKTARKPYMLAKIGFVIDNENLNTITIENTLLMLYVQQGLLKEIYANPNQLSGAIFMHFDDYKVGLKNV